MEPVEERDVASGGDGLENVLCGRSPVVFRNLAADWPAVRAARSSDERFVDYILGLDAGSNLEVMVGPPEIEGRFFYSTDLTGFNFHREQVPAAVLLKELLRIRSEPTPHSLYAGAAATDDHFPGWATANCLPIELAEAKARIWLGNASRVTTHFDLSSNIACVVAGRRRFTLFPPDQVANLYIGPIDRTMAGQPSSMVDIERPDYERHPRFAEAVRHALVAELGPGDAILIPTLWWHEVRALDPFNVLVNYWFGQRRDGSPFDAFVHALLAIRDLPAEQREGWRAWFDHYVFGAESARTSDHLPSAAQGVLGPSSAERTDLLRSYLLRALGR